MEAFNGNDLAITRDSLYGTYSEPTYAGVTSFMRRRYSRDLSGVDLVVTGVPFDTATTNRPGTRFGPRAIRAASITSAWERHYPWEFDPFDHLAVINYGDCNFDHALPHKIPAAIEAHAEQIVAARQGLVDPARSVQIGLRTTNDDTLGFQVLDAPEVHRRGAQQIAELIRARVGDNPVYLTFDIDCLDPAFAPGTGTPVCGGLSSHQALDILRGLRGINLVGMDVVEVSPPYDHAEITALAGATVAMEMVCLYAARHKLGEGV